MLTATPLQNNLRELYALSQYIDERIFINENIFNQMYVIPEDFNGLREAIAPILHRTLRKEVVEYLKFSSRDCMSIDFKLSRDEAILYQLVNEYLQRPVLYAVESKNNALVKMVLRKLLASSSFAVIETFEILKERLKVLKKNTKAEKADVSLKAFFKMIDDDDDSSDDEQEDDDIEKIERDRYRAEINSELAYIKEIIKIASKIKKNSKAEAVITALTFAFDEQRKTGYDEKALIFTESKRTQKYLVESLYSAGFDKILVFNGEMNDPDTKKLYNAWKAKNLKRVTNTPGIDLKQAIVDQFHNDAKILVATDSASEGLNLQFCDTVINYDLPWNPMKIEQRIGRCHRFGQERDVWVYNLLNTENAADKRVYEILKNKFYLFKGVFGASDEALGLLESGSNFEKRVMGIYERCKTQSEFTKEFDRLEREITPARNKKHTELKHILSSVSSDEKKKNLAVFAERLKTHFSSLEDWSNISSDKKSVVNEFLRIKDTQIEFNGVSSAHGYLFVGALSGSNKNFLQPILLLFDNNGEITGKEKKDIIHAFENIPEANFTRFQPDTSEMKIINSCYKKITSIMSENHFEKSKPIITQNDRRVQNWIDNRQGQYKVESNDIRQKISDLRTQKNLSKYFQEKIDIQKKIDTLEKSLRKRDEDFHDEMLKIQHQAEEERMKFNRQFEIETIAIINLVVKF
jgi:superfamily II DNA/RNA helicase